MGNHKRYMTQLYKSLNRKITADRRTTIHRGMGGGGLRNVVVEPSYHSNYMGSTVQPPKLPGHLQYLVSETLSPADADWVGTPIENGTYTTAIN